jgi:hypothetical protein
VAGVKESEMNRLAELADELVEDIMPQIGGLCIQRFDHLNELCMLLSQWKKFQAEVEPK